MTNTKQPDLFEAEKKAQDLMPLPMSGAGLALQQDADLIKEFRRRMEAFTKRMNTAPEAGKILKHPKENYHYIPISAIEKDLFKQFFGLVQYEVVSYQQIFNEVVCHARIKVFHPVISQWLSYDGMGSAIIQQDSGTKVADFMNFKKSNAMQLTAPRSYAEAIKNAAKKIGKRYGADLNRNFEDHYSPQISASDAENKPLNQ